MGFYPASQVDGGNVVMPLTFVDGSSAEVIAPRELGIQHMSASVYTSGGLGGTDRTMNFRYREPAGFLHKGPLATYEGHDGDPVEVWQGTPGDWECPNLVFQFDDWFVAVRICQPDLSESDKKRWARLLKGEVVDGGFLVLSATPPLQLTEAGEHEGPQLYLGMEERSNWIQLLPGKCDPDDYAKQEDAQVMADGTPVAFSRLGGENSKIKHNWVVGWCEDGLLRVQVEYASRNFARAAAEGLRLRRLALAD